MSDCCSVNPKNGTAPAVMPCPVNGARSKQVDVLTVKSLVRQLPLGMPNDQYYFCEACDCDVVYFPFDAQEPVFRREDLLVRVGAKEKADPIPVCYCFGFTRKDIHDEIANTGHSTVADRITAEVKAGNCACEVKNPSGKCCLGNVTRAAKDGLGLLHAGSIQSNADRARSQKGSSKLTRRAEACCSSSAAICY